ncbi:DUF4262 domain-containing protein [Thalassotalea litorea]|uniref:DUF4262 domain-containing protein n=1 Tax=Thalassotalea litorea TaxID=2020715 RepID=UPI003735455E
MWLFKNNKQHKKISKNIEEHGWQFQFVFDENGEKVDFAYTIGFEETFAHPEIMIFGLKKETMHTILADIAYELKSGKVFTPNNRIPDVISGGLDVMFKPLKNECIADFAGIASQYYDKPFRVLVMLWPDRNNILPTEANCELTIQNEALKVVS